jgi:predicted small lipoprotein YifL
MCSRCRRRWLIPFATLSLTLLFAAGAACGRKGPPVPPEDRVPMRPNAVNATVLPNAIVVEWTNPVRRVDGSRLQDVALARLYRRDDGGAGEPRAAIRDGERIVGYTLLAVIDLARPQLATVQGNRVRYVDRAGLIAGRRYTYVVTATDSLERTSAPSERLSVAFITAPLPPVGPTAEAGEAETRLEWGPPAALVDEGPLTGGISYEILRSTSPDVPPASIATALTSLHYTDTGLQNEQTYYYAVRAIRADGDGVARSEPSPTIAVTPRDMTPPTAPTGLVAIPAGATVRLAWNPSPEADVAGYVIYRVDAGGDRVRVGRTFAPDTVFVDRDVAAGTYRYIVTAIDRASRPNESTASETVSVAVP